jgi:hypothetical protein
MVQMVSSSLKPKQNVKTNPVIDISDRYTDSNTIQQLAKALANLSHTPPIEITKFTGDPNDYLRFVNRFRDQVLPSQFKRARSSAV